MESTICILLVLVLLAHSWIGDCENAHQERCWGVPSLIILKTMFPRYYQEIWPAEPLKVSKELSGEKVKMIYLGLLNGLKCEILVINRQISHREWHLVGACLCLLGLMQFSEPTCLNQLHNAAHMYWHDDSLFCWTLVSKLWSVCQLQPFVCLYPAFAALFFPLTPMVGHILFHWH